MDATDFIDFWAWAPVAFCMGFMWRAGTFIAEDLLRTFSRQLTALSEAIEAKFTKGGQG